MKSLENWRTVARIISYLVESITVFGPFWLWKNNDGVTIKLSKTVQFAVHKTVYTKTDIVYNTNRPSKCCIWSKNLSF